MHFPPKIRQILPPCDNCDIKNGRKHVKKFGQPWLILTVQYLVCILTVAIFTWVSGQRTSYLFLSFLFYCPPKKIRPGKAEQNEKASSLYRLRQLTITKKMKRCVPLRRNLAEKPRGMRLKFVLSQLRTCTHESENMFVFFKSRERVSLVQPLKTRWGLKVGSVFILYPDPTLAVKDLGTRQGVD